jgi:mono/diheme cytochrome c family protein
MRRRTTLRRVVAAGLALAAMGAAARAGDVETGRELAQSLCARCHLNEGQGEKQEASEIPGFRAVANRPGATERGIVAWLKSLPVVMPDHHLTQDEMDSLAIYILSLRERR